MKCLISKIINSCNNSLCCHGFTFSARFCNSEITIFCSQVAVCVMQDVQDAFYKWGQKNPKFRCSRWRKDCSFKISSPKLQRIIFNWSSTQGIKCFTQIKCTSIITHGQTMAFNNYPFHNFKMTYNTSCTSQILQTCSFLFPNLKFYLAKLKLFDLFFNFLNLLILENLSSFLSTEFQCWPIIISGWKNFD